MEDTNKIVESTQSDDDDDLPPGQSSSVILENPNSEMIEEISTYFEASQCMLGNSSEEPLVTAADSESIERPILSQVPVSRARRYRRSTRSEATTASEESGGESASSVSQPARSSARSKNLKGRNKWAFQAFRSSFFEGNSFNTTLPSLKISPFSNIQQEAKVKTFAVGGFFKCIRLWHRVNQKRYVRATCLPALYMDADESLSPLSEGNETSDEEGIKVVSNDFFVQSRKGQCPQGQGSVPAKGVRGRCTRPVQEPGSQAKTGRTSDGAKRARGLGTQPVDGTGSHATLRRTSPRAKGVRGLGAQPVDGTGSRATLRRTSPRAKGVRGLGAQPVDGTGSHDKNGPSSSPHPSPPGEEWSTASSQPEDHLGFESAAGNGAMVEESSEQVSQKDPTSDVTPVQQVTPPPEMPCTGNNISGPALASQPTSGSDMIINNDQNLNLLGDQSEDLWRRKKISKKKKPSTDGVITEGKVNVVVVDTASTDKTSTLTEPTAVGFKKQKRKNDGMVPCSEDPEPIPASGYTEGGNPFKHPADRVALEDDTSEASSFSQRTFGSTMSINNDDVDFEHTRRRKRKKEKKRKATEDEAIHMSLEGPCPALGASDISQSTSESVMTMNNNNDDDEEHRKRKKRKKEKKPRFPEEEEEMNVSLDGPCPAVEPSDVSQGTSDSGTTINNNNCDDEEHRKIKKRKKEKKRKVASGEEVNIPLDAPRPALETFDVSQRTSESTMTINSNHSLDCAVDHLEDILKPRKKSKKKKSRTNGVVTEGVLNVADTASPHETSTLAETTAGFKKGKGKKDKIAPCGEDPETNPEADNMESEHCSFKHPADEEVECQRKKRRKQKMSETARHAVCEDTPVRGSGLTSAREKTRKRHHSFLSDDTMENPPKTNKISTCDVDTQPVENGETLMESLIVETKKKKKQERDASRVNEECEGSVLTVGSSAETGDDDTGRKKKKKKKKKKMKDKADRESESPVVVDRETPDDIETTVLIKKKKSKKNTRPPSQGSTPTEARDESEVTTPTDSIAVSPRRCSSVVDTDATQAGNVAIPNDGATVKKKTGRKRQENASGVGTCDSDVPEQNIRTTTEPLQHWTVETESCLKKKKNKKKDGRVMDRIEAATDPEAIEAQRSGHEAEVASQGTVPPESRTHNHHESSSKKICKKKALKRKPLFNQGQDFLDTESIRT